MKYLFLDTETNGLPKNVSVSHVNVDNWPRLVSIAWAIVDDDKKIYEFEKRVVKPIGFKIIKESTDVHGITTEYAEENGIHIVSVLTDFMTALSQCDAVAGHNVRFDRKVVAAELYRNFEDKRYDEILYGTRYRDTMHVSRELLKIPYTADKKGRVRKGWKFPSLSEMYKEMYGSILEDAHDASVDVQATIKCFFGLKELGMVDRFYETHRDVSKK